MLSNLQTYLERLAQLRQNTQATGELSLRPALDELFQSLKPVGVDFVGEGKQLASGRPDFTFTRGAYDEPIGYVEAEKVAANLSKLTGHAKTQNARFSKDLDNFLLTNHLDFRLYDKGKKVESVVLPESSKDLTEKHGNDFARLWDKFTGAQIASPKTPTELATLLARRARTLRLAIEDSLKDPASPLLQDLAAFKKLLLPDLNKDDFANLYAETLTYGLFAARCQMPDNQRFNPHNADRSLRRTPLLRTLYRLFEADVPANLEWVLDDMAAILNGAAIDEIRNYFENRAGRPDPMIDFYEPFLAQYDAKARQSRGVYYTPEPVVSYIVRSVHALLQSHFDLSDGVAGGAKILDPATGTGSFLFAVLEQMHTEIGAGSWKAFVRDKKPLDNLFGFELMVAPYTIAHLKLALQMEGLDTPLGEAERVGIYLTNALDNARRQSEALLEGSIADEVNAAADVKDETKILVVLGNPPYAGHGVNATYKGTGKKKEFSLVGRTVESYKVGVEGIDRPGKAKWLQNDYVKFMAFAQNRILTNGEGLIAFITDNGYLNKKVFSGLRRSLINSFTTIYILNLHGDSRIKEVTPEGLTDQNVFQIQQGTSIILAVKEKEKVEKAEIFYCDVWGKTQEKFDFLEGHNVKNTIWRDDVKPESPRFLLLPLDTNLLPEYEEGTEIDDIFAPMGDPALGFVTQHDDFAVSFTAQETQDKVAKLLSTQNREEADLAFNLCKQEGKNAQWVYEEAKEGLSDGKWENDITQFLYRPFDVRSTAFNKLIAVNLRRRLATHFAEGENLGLCVCNGYEVGEFDHVFCSKMMLTHHAASLKEGTYAFPLYIYTPSQKPTKTQTGSLEGLDLDAAQLIKRPNLSADYLAKLAAITGTEPTPEEVFGYIYARLHGPKYRQKFAAFLKTDFPRVPMPTSRQQFEQFAKLGAELVALHTLDTKAAPALKEKRHTFSAGSDAVEKVSYDAATRQIMINETQGFGDVDAETYSFKIGGYTVADKWLSDRKGRTLSFDEQRLYPQILIALAETRRVMSEIEAMED